MISLYWQILLTKNAAIITCEYSPIGITRDYVGLFVLFQRTKHKLFLNVNETVFFPLRKFLTNVSKNQSALC